MTLLDMLHLTFTGRKKLNGDISKRIAYRMMHELMHQKGFLGWLNSNLSDDDQEILLETLIDIVCQEIED
jgi:hypothetical protein